MGTDAERHSLARRAEIYWVESRRPLASLAFVAPLLAIYETGVLWCKTPPNGADAFMKWLLQSLGFGHLVLPLLVVGILLGWHFLTHAPWRFSGGTLPAMLVESILLSLCVWGIAIALHVLAPNNILKILGQKAQLAVSFLGAGIYEELLFRLMLLSLLAWLIRLAGCSPGKSMIAAALVASLLFAAAHHVGAYGESFTWQRFAFRALAGLFFSIVYVYRGFGIAAGSHAAYDIIVGVFCM
jgi:membrane protease YdiL (CAAX protease family)